MSEKKLGIIGGGQLGSMLSQAAKKLNIKTIVYTDDKDAPAHSQEFDPALLRGRIDPRIKGERRKRCGRNEMPP